MMNTVWHLLKFEVRRLAVAGVFFGLMLMVWFWLLWRMPYLATGEEDFSTRLVVLHLLGGGVFTVLLTAMSLWLGQGQPSRRTDAFWRTRPIHPRTILVVKMIVLAAILTAICMTGNFAKVAWGFSWGQAFSTGWVPLLLGFAPGMVLVLIMAMAGSWPRFLVVFTIGVVLLAVGWMVLGVVLGVLSGWNLGVRLDQLFLWRWGDTGGYETIAPPGGGQLLLIFSGSVSVMVILGFWNEFKTRRLRRLVLLVLLTPAVSLSLLLLWPVSEDQVASPEPLAEYRGALEASKEARWTEHVAAILRFRHSSDASRWLVLSSGPTLNFEWQEGMTSNSRRFADRPSGWESEGLGNADLAAYDHLQVPRVAFIPARPERFWVPTSADAIRTERIKGQQQDIELLSYQPYGHGIAGEVVGEFEAREFTYEKIGDYSLAGQPRIFTEDQVTHVRRVSLGKSENRYQGETVLFVDAVSVRLQDYLGRPSSYGDIGSSHHDLKPRYFLIHPRERQAIEIRLGGIEGNTIRGWEAQHDQLEISFKDHGWPPGVSPITTEDLPKLRCVVLEPKPVKRIRVKIPETPWHWPMGIDMQDYRY